MHARTLVRVPGDRAVVFCIIVVVAVVAGSAGGLLVALARPTTGDMATRADLDDVSGHGGRPTEHGR